MFRLAAIACLACAFVQAKKPVVAVVVTAYPQVLRDALPEFEKQFGSGLLHIEAAENLDCKNLEEADVLYIHGAGWTPEMQACGTEVRRLQERGLKISGTIPAIAQMQSRWRVTPNADLNDAEPYLRFGGSENMIGFLAALFNATSAEKLNAEAAKPRAEAGIYHPNASTIFLSLDEYLKWYRASGLIQPDTPLVGLTFFQSNYFYGDLKHIDALIAALEKRGIGVIPAFGWPLKAAEPFLVQDGHPVIEMLFCLNLLMPSSENANLLAQYGIHAINLMTTTATFAQWGSATLGLPPGRTALQLGTPERTGATEPILIATTEKTSDGKSILVPVTERVEMAAARAERWITLRHKSNADKRVALIYFNNPPGKGMLGASYLNLFPSLNNILKALQTAGYSTSPELPSEERLKKLLLLSGRNVGDYAPGELDALIHDGHVTLLPLQRYQKWYAKLPQAFRERTEKTWGKPSAAKLMTVRRDGELFFVIPGVKLGNVYLGPQPLRDSLTSAPAAQHSADHPAPHSYIAYYLWLRHEFGADAVVHIGRHGTLEWLPGKDVAQSGDDAGEVLIGDLPNAYYYLVDGGGEFLQAKRRSQAVIISHLTPLLAAAGSNPDYAKLQESLEHRRQLEEGDDALRAQYDAEILKEARRLRFFEKLGLPASETLSVETVARLEEYFDEQEDESIPLGLHIIGAPPPEAAIRDALCQFLQSSFSGDEARQARPHIAQWTDDLVANRSSSEAPELLAKVRKEAENWLEDLYWSPARELESLLTVLAGRGLPTGVSGDPLRTPGALPTGRNMHDQDPRNFPTKAAWEVGKRMADALLADQQKIGQPLEKASFVLWYGESNRHQGIAEAQALYLLGVEPVWNGRGQVEDVKLIPTAQLGRPRVDVVLTMSGLYRDGMPEKLQLLDRAVKLAAAAEGDNVIRRNAMLVEQRLERQGVDAETARKAGFTRLFGPAPQSFSPGLAGMMESSADNNDQSKVANEYLANMNYAYSEGLWGQNITGNLGAQLSNNQVVVHSRSTNLYGVVDNDETYQFAGGLNAATTLSSGKAPEFLISNVRSAGKEHFEGMKKFVSRELDSRVWNPKWIQAMKDSGYAGAQEIAKETEHLYGLRATAPTQIDSSVWQQMFDVYVADKNKLGLKEFFDKENPYAQQMLTARLLEIDRQGVYRFSEGDRRQLVRTFIESVNSHGVSCYANACANRSLRSYVLRSSRELAAVVPGQLQKWQDTVRKATGETVTAQPSSISKTQKAANPYVLSSLLSKVRLVSSEEFERRFRGVHWGGSWAYFFAAALLLGSLYPFLAKRLRYWSFDPVAFRDSLRATHDHRR